MASEAESSIHWKPSLQIGLGSVDGTAARFCEVLHYSRAYSLIGSHLARVLLKKFIWLAPIWMRTDQACGKTRVVQVLLCEIVMIHKATL